MCTYDKLPHHILRSPSYVYVFHGSAKHYFNHVSNLPMYICTMRLVILLSTCAFVCADFDDVTGHVDDRYATTSITTTTSTTAAAAAAADGGGGANDAADDYDDVDDLSSSDVSSFTDAKHNSHLTSSTDDNIASCRSA